MTAAILVLFGVEIIERAIKAVLLLVAVYRRR